MPLNKNILSFNLIIRTGLVIAISIATVCLFANPTYSLQKTDSTISISAHRSSTSHSISFLQGQFLPISAQPFFLLVIGNDYRPGVEGKRADAIHLFGINPIDNKVTILNFPRDTTVSIPGHGRNKINAANAFGGSSLTAQTLEQLVGVRISYILEADFAAFTGLIDDLGGIDITVEKPMHDSSAGSNFNPGSIHMNGHQALAFSRDRHSFSNGDLQRTQNQAIVLTSALAELKKTRTTITSQFEAVGIMKKHLAVTNLTSRDIYFLMSHAEKIDPNSIKSVLVPWSGSNTLAPKATDLFNDFKDNAILDSYAG